MDILKIVESRLIFYLSLTTRRVYYPHILITSVLDKLSIININLRESFVVLFDPVTLIHVW